jgi:hypothetical protein
VKTNDPKRDADETHEVATALTILYCEFYEPTCQLLFKLLEHQQAAVRIFATCHLREIVAGMLPCFSLEPLAEVAFRLRQRMDDPDLRVRACAAEQLEKLLDAAAALGAAYKTARMGAAERN